VFCRNCLEDRNHMYFEGPFTRRLWGSIIHLCLVYDPIYSWADLIAWGIDHLQGKSLRVSIFKIAWDGPLSTIYRYKGILLYMLDWFGLRSSY
jgi:hypothetical protein